MHDWFATEVRMIFSRPMPLQIAGEAVGMRQTVDYKLSPRHSFGMSTIAFGGVWS
jgi:hypothetical protein